MKTLAELTALSDREIDVLIAVEIEGFDIGELPEHTWARDGDVIDNGAYTAYTCNGPECTRCGYHYCVHCCKKCPSDICVPPVAYYSSSLDLIRPIELKVIEKVGKAMYADAIQIAVFGCDGLILACQEHPVPLTSAVMATARQRAIASLLCWAEAE